MKVETSAVDKRQYKVLSLDNDLEILLISDTTTDKAACALDVKVGSYLDKNAGEAHFLEHMLFMGTSKYEDENDYQEYLSKHGGSSNAYTDLEHTNYYFDISTGKDNFEGALDRFSQFFIAPLLKQSSVDKERQAVDSEHAKNLQSDTWRAYQLSKSLSREDHPYSKFGTGNAESLNIPNIREALLEFYDNHYSSNLMKVCLLSDQSLDELEIMARQYFFEIKNKSLPQPAFDGNPFPESLTPCVLQVVPVKQSISLDLQFCLRETETLWKSKPTRYLSHLLGHESEGSILALLKEKQWAFELSAGESRTCSDWTGFTISITLTEEGLLHYEEVVEIVFAYLNLLREQGSQEWIFEETRNVAETQFRFLSQRDPMDYVSGLASQMHSYPAEQFLSGPYKLFDYDPAQVEELLDCMIPRNVLLILASKSFEGKTSLKEKWYGVDYEQVSIEPDILDKWSNATSPELALPPQNDLIATDFDLLDNIPPETPKDQPQLLLFDDNTRLWYKPDTEFQMPKCNILISLNIAGAYDSPKSTILTSLYQQACSEISNEFTYLASMAGLHCYLTTTRTGIELHVSGYHDKIHVLLQKVVDKMASLEKEITEELLTRLQQKFVLQLQNFFVAAPYQHALYATDLVLLDTKWTTEQKLAALQNIAKADVDNYIRSIQIESVEMLVHGNASPEKAKEYCNIVTQKFTPSSSSKCFSTDVRVIQLEPGQNTVYRTEEYNPENTNSALEVILEVGPVSLRVNAMISFVQHLLREPAFNELRTNEQLGYIVHTSVHTAGSHVKGLLLLIQSDQYDPIYLDGRVDAFLERTRARLCSMSAEEFQTNIDAVVANFLEKNKNLSEESSKYWDAISQHNYIFTKYAQIAEVVKDIDKVSVLRFYDKHLASSSPSRRKLSVQVFSKQHSDKMTEPVAEGGVVLEDLEEFKRTSSLYPLPAATDVSSFCCK